MRRAVRGQRVRLSPAAIQREHLLTAQPLVQRVDRDERLELSGHLGLASEGEVGVDPLAQTVEPQILEPRDLWLGKALVAHLG